MMKRIVHIGIATRSIAVLTEFYKTLGLEVDTIEVVKEQKVKIAIMKVGDSAVELIEATEKDSPITRFIEKRGEGIHHISFEVDDIQQMLDLLKEKNVKLLDEKPRKGAQGRLIAFIHPHSTGGVLVELSQPAPEEEA